MRIIACEVLRFELPLARPLTLKGTIIHARVGALVRLRSENGTIGLGEIAPLPGFSRESLEEALDQLHRITSHLLGTPTDEWSRRLDDVSPSVRFGLESAMLDLTSNETNTTIRALLSLEHRDVIDVCGLIADSGKGAIDEATRLVRSGFRHLKLKIGSRSIEDDANTVRCVREAIGDSIELRLDANRAWGWEDAVAFARRVSSYGVYYIEEPLRSVERLDEFGAATGASFALDESLVESGVSMLDVAPHARAVVLKPMLLGGIETVINVAKAAVARGMLPVVSAAFESGFGLGVLANIAATSDFSAVAGLDTYSWLQTDISDFVCPDSGRLMRHTMNEGSLVLKNVDAYMNAIREADSGEFHHA